MAPPLDREQILRRQSLRESAARTYARSLPIVPVRARGLTIEGADGRRYLDCLSGAGTLALGHNHPVVLEAIRAVLDSGAPLHVLDLATPVKDAFTSELFATLPRELAEHGKVQFCGPAGTDAVEAALTLVRTATGRSGLMAFTGAYHGMTAGALAASGGARDTSVTRLPYPYAYRCPFGTGGARDLGPDSGTERGTDIEPDSGTERGTDVVRGTDLVQGTDIGQGSDDREAEAAGRAVGDAERDAHHAERGAELAARWAENALADPKSGVPRPAAMILEPVQGEGGVIPAPDSWLRRMREITAAHDVPLIVDEVQTGVGRTGAFWAVEHSGIVPDVLVLSKAIGGSLPLAVIVYREELDTWRPGTHAGTFRGNQLAMAAGAATLAYVRENGLAAHAAELGARMLARLRGLAAHHDCIGDVRGRGLMLGVELVEPAGPVGADGAPPPASRLAAEVQQQCLDRGLIVELGGRGAAVVRLLPPLTLTDEQADAVLDRLADAIAAAVRTTPGPTGSPLPTMRGTTP
ncbi:aminotransferase class III-fold pyridoxal phosphate-dependent enzyme [Streptomyces olivaceiscleroticus]